MLTKTLEISLPGTISDAVILGDRMCVALDSGLAVIERGSLVRTVDIPVESLVTSDDSSTVLAVSPILEFAARIPWRRRVHRLAAPFVVPEDLGIVPVEGFSGSFDGRYWPTYEGDDIHLFECTDRRLDVATHYATDWPIHIERIPQGIWLEVSSLGANHFQILSMPDLRLIDDGTFRCFNMEFPPETIAYKARSPTLSQPVVAIHAAGSPTSLDKNGKVKKHPIRNVDRIMIPDGRVITTLPAPAAGLVASGERALSWFPTEGAVEFVLICLVTTRVKDRFVIEGATKAGARIMGRDILVWERETLHVFRDAGSAAS